MEVNIEKTTKTKASILITARNRNELLKKTLGSLTNQDANLNDFEVVVCDHGSSDNIQMLCEEFHCLFRIKYVFYPYDNKIEISGPKNQAAREAVGDILIFLDSGIICSKSFVSEHIRLHENRPGICVVGYAHGWDCEKVDKFWRSIDPCRPPSFSDIPESIHDLRLRTEGTMKNAPWIYMWGCNFSIRNDLFWNVGGFEESFSGWGWDDLDLAFGFFLKEIEFVFSNEAWGLHYPHPRLALMERCRQAKINWRRTYNKYKHPDLEFWDTGPFELYGRTIDSIQKRQASFHVPELKESCSDCLHIGFNNKVPFDNYCIIPPSADDSRESTKLSNNTYSGWGLITPFDELFFSRALISTFWRAYTFRVSEDWTYHLLYYLLMESSRVAHNIELLFDSEVTDYENKILFESINLANLSKRVLIKNC